jgi:hypothetical protein
MKKGFSFLIIVAAALLTLAYQAEHSPLRAGLAPVDLTTTLPSGSASSLQVSTPSVPMTVSRLPASVAQPLEIEEVEAQN